MEPLQDEFCSCSGNLLSRSLFNSLQTFQASKSIPSFLVGGLPWLISAPMQQSKAAGPDRVLFAKAMAESGARRGENRIQARAIRNRSQTREWGGKQGPRRVPREVGPGIGGPTDCFQEPPRISTRGRLPPLSPRKEQQAWTP